MPRKSPFHVNVSAHPKVVSGEADLPRLPADAWFEHWIPGERCRVTGTLEEVPGGLRVNTLMFTLSALDEIDAGITDAVVGKLKLGRVVINAASQLAEQLAPFDSPDSRFARTGRAAKAEAKRLKRGRTGYPLSHYRHVAETYLRFQRDVDAGSIYDRLATEESRRLGRQIPRETVRHWVKRAKEEGFLIPRGQGQRGMYAGPRLHENRGEAQ